MKTEKQKGASKRKHEKRTSTIVVMTQKRVAESFHVTERTVKGWGSQGLLVPYQSGDGQMYYTMDSINALALKKPHLLRKRA